jgi:hypothetical protein
LSYTNIDSKNLGDCQNFLEDNFLLKLNVFSQDNDENHQNWREKALEVIDDHQIKHSLNDDA